MLCKPCQQQQQQQQLQFTINPQKQAQTIMLIKKAFYGHKKIIARSDGHGAIIMGSDRKEKHRFNNDHNKNTANDSVNILIKEAHLLLSLLLLLLLYCICVLLLYLICVLIH